MMRVEGVNELATALVLKSEHSYGETMRILWKAADDGLALYKAAVPRDSEETAQTASAATYGIPWRTRQGVRSVWGPTTKQGRLMETGSAHNSPHPTLGPTLDQVAPGAIRELEKVAGDL